MPGNITAYLGQGLAASRPATPSVATGGLAFYFASDTEVLSLYDANDAAWQTVVAGGGDMITTNNLSDVASAATSRTNLGATTVGANVFTLTNPSAITFLRFNADNTVSALDAAAFRTAIGAGSGTGDLVASNNLSDVASAAVTRTNLGLAIGTNVQAYSANLGALGGVTSAADRLPYFTGSGTATVATFTAAARSLLDDATVSDMRTTLGLAIGTNVQAFNVNLSTYAGIAPSANVQTILAGANYAAVRASLGLTAATPTDVWTGTSDTTVISPKIARDSTIPTALTSATTITPNFNAGANFSLTLAHDATLANPSNAQAGDNGVITITQDAAGNRTLAYGSEWKFSGGDPSLSTAAGSVDALVYYVAASGVILCNLIKGFA